MRNLNGMFLRASWMAVVMVLAGSLIGAAQEKQLTALKTFEAEPGELFASEGLLYFAGAEGASTNVEPWISNGTRSGTRLLGDLIEGPEGSYPNSFFYCYPEGGFSFTWDGNIFFAADFVISNGENRLYNMRKGYRTPTLFDYDPFGADAGASYDVTSATRTSSGIFFASTYSGYGGSFPEYGTELTIVQDYSYYNGYGRVESWRVDIRPGPESSFPEGITAVDDRLRVAMSADDGAHGREYVRAFLFYDSDGSEWRASHAVHDLRVGGEGSFPRDFTNTGPKTFFTADNGIDGRELWLDNGSGGVSMLKDIFPGSNSSTPANLTSLGNGSILFTAFTADAGLELWISDGTADGTVMVEDIRPGVDSSSPSGLHYVNGFVYFSANDGVSGSELWRSDGSAPGTVLVRDIRPGPAGSSPGGALRDWAKDAFSEPNPRVMAATNYGSPTARRAARSYR